jgi:serine/threonine protein kinase
MGAAAMPPGPPDALPPGTRLGEFELRGTVGLGRHGIVYLAFDHALEREVAIREYLPPALAARLDGPRAGPRSRALAAAYDDGLRAFVDAGRRLAQLDAPGLLRVHRVWEDNGTAYVATPLVDGRTLAEWRRAQSAPPDEASAQGLLRALLAAVDALHRAGGTHGAIAPAHIAADDPAHPVLLDPEAVRRAADGAAAASPARLLGEGVAEPQSEASPSADLQALGRALRFVLLGDAAASAPPLLAADGVPGHSPQFLRIVDWLSAPRPAERPPTAADVLAALDGRIDVPRLSPPVAVAPPPPPPPPLPSSPPAGDLRPAIGVTGSPTVVETVGDSVSQTVGDAVSKVVGHRLGTSAGSAVGRSASALVGQWLRAAFGGGSASRAAWRWGALVALVAAAAGGGWWLGQRQEPSGPTALLSDPATRSSGGPAASAASTVSPAPTASPASPAPAALPASPVLAASSAPAAVRAVAAGSAPARTRPTVRHAPQPGPAPASAPALPAVAGPPPLPATPPARRPRPEGAVATPTAPPVGSEAGPADVSKPGESASAAAARAPSSPPPSASATGAAKKGPRDICGRRVFLALVNCMNRECAKPEFRDLPECTMYKPPGP